MALLVRSASLECLRVEQQQVKRPILVDPQTGRSSPTAIGHREDGPTNAVERVGEHLVLRSSTEFAGDVACVRGEEEAYLVDGSKYDGTWDATIGMVGVGRYSMPHGVTYEGEFRDGTFHGYGSLEWPEEQRIDGVWLRGKFRKKRYAFVDGLVYREDAWDYCRYPDRRYLDRGRTVQGDGERASKVIPAHWYDAGDGAFDPETLRVVSYLYPKEVLRIPKRDECEWIMDNCRKGDVGPSGYRTWLSATWSDDLPYKMAMSADSPESWWIRARSFERDVQANAKETSISTKNE